VVVPISYNVGSGTYSTFVDNVRTVLATHPSPDSVQGHPVLTKERFRDGNPPVRLLQVELSAGNTSATLAIRDDNVYVVGFRPPSGTWYELHETAKGPKQQQHVIAGSTLLDWGFTYRGFVGGGTSKEVKKNLKDMDLGKAMAEAAVRQLAAYVHAGAPDAATKLALARLMIMVSEAARLDSVYATVNSGWGQTSRLSEMQPVYMQNWGDLSSAILEWRQKGNSYKWPRKLARETGIKDAADALAVVHLLLNR
jgi:hypothetical protein